MDKSITDVYYEHSGLFYLFVAIAFCLIVWGWMKIERSKTAKAASAIGDMVGIVTRRMVDTDRGTEEHKSLSTILAELKDKQRSIELKRK